MSKLSAADEEERNEYLQALYLDALNENRTFTQSEASEKSLKKFGVGISYPLWVRLKEEVEKAWKVKTKTAKEDAKGPPTNTMSKLNPRIAELMAQLREAIQEDFVLTVKNGKGELSIRIGSFSVEVL